MWLRMNFFIGNALYHHALHPPTDWIMFFFLPQDCGGRCWCRLVSSVSNLSNQLSLTIQPIPLRKLAFSLLKWPFVFFYFGHCSVLVLCLVSLDLSLCKQTNKNVALFSLCRTAGRYCRGRWSWSCSWRPPPSARRTRWARSSCPRQPPHQATGACPASHPPPSR